MKISTMIKTGTALAALGAAAYFYNQATPATRRKVKRSAGKAIHTFGDACNDISKMM